MIGRRPDIGAMYQAYIEEGLTLEAVGDRFGVTRQRVQQLFKRAALPKRTAEQTAAARRLSDEDGARAVRLYRHCGDEREVARQMGLPVRHVRNAIHERLPQAAVFHRKSRQRPKYTTEELIGFLQDASRQLGGVLTAASYTAFVRGRVTGDGRPWPTHQTMHHRFGSWRLALQHAGLRANDSSAIAGQYVFEAGHCIDAIRACARQLDRVPTAADYERFASEAAGGLPSLATVRHRCGSWHLARRVALAEMGTGRQASAAS